MPKINGCPAPRNYQTLGFISWVLPWDTDAHLVTSEHGTLLWDHQGPFQPQPFHGSVMSGTTPLFDTNCSKLKTLLTFERVTPFPVGCRCPVPSGQVRVRQCGNSVGPVLVHRWVSGLIHKYSGLINPGFWFNTQSRGQPS